MTQRCTRRALTVLVLGLLTCGSLAAGAQTSRSAKSEQAQRALDLTTDEGTWISVDVSPDGRMLVFDLLGHLYTLPIEGGIARPITSGVEFSSQPKFSPDGRKIAFVSDRDGAENLWIANVDGSNTRQLSKTVYTEFASPVWLPDGNTILVSRQTRLPLQSFELWAYHVDGGVGLAVVKSKDKPDLPAEQWRHTIGAMPSTDGRYVYYARRTAVFHTQVPFPYSQIVRRDRATGEEHDVTAAPGSAFRPVLSPDGALLAYGTRYETETGLRLLDLRTGEERWLKYPVQRDDQESAFAGDLLPGYAFTPDCKEVVASYGGKIHRIDVASGKDRLIPFKARISRELGPLLDFPARVEDGPVRWRTLQGAAQSPDGKRLAFSAATRLYAMDVPGGAPQRLTKSDDREYQPAWSPDGNWIAYVTWSTAGGHIWKVRGDGSGSPIRLTQVPAYYREVVWSPEGNRVVALRAPRQWHLAKTAEWVGGGEMLDLISVPAQGGPTRVIARAGGLSAPHFVKQQTDRVYFYSEQGLGSMRLDGTDRRVHVKVVRNVWFPDPLGDYTFAAEEARLSPDGKWVAIRQSSQMYLVPAPSFGGEPLQIDLTRVPEPAGGPERQAGNAPAGPIAALPVKKLTRIGADFFGWSDDGRALTWTLGPSFFRQSLTELSAGRGGAQEIAIDLRFPRATPSGSMVLRGGRVISMRGDEVIEDADVLVTNNRIARVGKRESFAVPADAKVFDVAGATVLPGFIDIHAHWTEIRRGVLDPDNHWGARANLAYGVTTGRDPQTKTNDLFAYQDLIDMGELAGPRSFSTGPGVFPSNNFQSYEQVRDVVARYRQYYRTNTLKSYLVGDRRHRQWMVQACKELGIMPTAEGGMSLKLDLTHMIDGFSGNEHNLPIVPLYKDVIELMAQSKITYTPTLLVVYGGPIGETHFYTTADVHADAKARRFVPHPILDARARRRSAWVANDEHVFPSVAAQAKKMAEAGGRVTIGSHGQLQGLAYHWEMWALASGGWNNLEVLRSATLRGAEAIGYARDLGSIEPGKLADLVVMAKDPLRDIRNTNSVRYVVKNGELFDGDTLQAVWPARKAPPKMWWWNEAPMPN